MNPKLIAAPAPLLDLAKILEIQKEDIRKLTDINYEVFPSPEMCRINENGEIVAASFSQLLLYLTNPEGTNLNFQDVFFTSFPMFSSPRMFLFGLFVRFFPCDCKKYPNIKVLRDRVISIIKRWSSKYFYQFDSNMKTAIEHFIIIAKDMSMPSCTIQVLHSIHDRLMERNDDIVRTIREPPPMILPPDDPNSWTLVSISPIELARQISLFYSKLFLSMKPSELLDALFGQKGTCSPHIDQLVSHFSSLANFVSLSVLMGENDAQRSRFHSHWLEVADAFNNERNYNGLFSVISGLTHRSVSRLTKTVEKSLNSRSKRQKMELLCSICDIRSDFRNYREILTSKAIEPCVPFFGCVHKDLVYIQEGFSNTVDGMINFKKCSASSKLIEILSRFQNQGYFYSPNDRIQTLIQGLPPPTDSLILMRISQSREQKK